MRPRRPCLRQRGCAMAATNQAWAQCWCVPAALRALPLRRRLDAQIALCGAVDDEGLARILSNFPTWEWEKVRIVDWLCVCVVRAAGARAATA